MVASHVTPPGTWPATQACALTGNGTGDPLVHGLGLNPLSHTSQSVNIFIFILFKVYFPPKGTPQERGPLV